MRLARRQETGVRSAESQRYAEALARSDRDVGAEFSGRTQQRQREQIGGDDDDDARRLGLRDPGFIVADHAVGIGVLDQWCVITVRDDDDWGRLRSALGDPEWARDPALQSAEGRLARQDEIDTALSAWTREHSKHEVTEILQRQRVPAGPMLTGSEQLDDPHFVARGYPRWLEQQDLGRMAFEGPSFAASGMSDIALFQAPRLGEHTQEICSELLGMQPAEIDRLLESGALETWPAPDAASS